MTVQGNKNVLNEKLSSNFYCKVYSNCTAYPLKLNDSSFIT